MFSFIGVIGSFHKTKERGKKTIESVIMIIPRRRVGNIVSKCLVPSSYIIISLNRQEQTCPNLAEGRALPQAKNSKFCKHCGVGKNLNTTGPWVCAVSALVVDRRPGFLGTQPLLRGIDIKKNSSRQLLTVTDSSRQ